jgi:hypothetical protein
LWYAPHPRDRGKHLSKESSNFIFVFFVTKDGTDVYKRLQTQTDLRGATKIPKIFIPCGVSTKLLTTHTSYLSSTPPLHLDSFTGKSEEMFFDGNTLTSVDKVGKHSGKRVTAYEYTHDGVKGFMVCRGLSDGKFDILKQLKKALDEKVKLYKSSKATSDEKN